MNEDFALYNNADRTSEQISAARLGIPARDDLLRWADRDTAAFLTRHPLPVEPLTAPDLAPYLAALAEAGNPAEAHAVTDRLLDTVEPVLSAVSDYLLAAAQWRGQLRSAPRNSPPRLLRDAASHSLAVMATTDAAALSALRSFYSPPPAPPAPPAPSPPRPATGPPGPHPRR
ncbi:MULTISPECIES: hypothetical protein [Streptomyces]|uniref:hypothetical protein n=1 Tax=Streptomyces TaxID=1883 RepID=UPI0005950C2B|nr:MULTISPECIES: hypothetical protein [Streptomyces]